MKWKKFKVKVKKIYKKMKNKLKTLDWKKILTGAKRPAIALIATGLAYWGGLQGWSWVAGISAERIYATIEYLILLKIK